MSLDKYCSIPRVPEVASGSLKDDERANQSDMHKGKQRRLDPERISLLPVFAV